MDNCDEFYIDICKSSDCHLQINDIFDKLIDLKNNGIKIVLMHIDDHDYIKNKVKNLFFVD